MSIPDLRAALAAALKCRVEDLPEPPAYDPVLEARIDHVASNWDPDTRTYQPPLRNVRRTR